MSKVPSQYMSTHPQAEPGEAVLEVNSLSKAFDLPVRPGGADDRFWSLRDISLCVRPGEALGIIGANGAGKSTLLKILAGIMRPTTGQVRFLGRVASILDIGSGFHPELSGRENIELSGRLLGFNKKEIASREDAIVAFSEIEPFIDTPVKYYSAGMFLRLAFSVVVHLPADLLLFDEVLAVGDAAFQQKCLSMVRELKQTARAFVLVSHDLNNLAQVCDRILVLERGRMAFAGDVTSALAYFARHMAPPEDATARPRPGVYRPPHSETVIELEVLVNGETGGGQMPLDCQHPIVFDISVTLRRPGAGLHLALAIADSKNNVLFGSDTLERAAVQTRQVQLTWTLPGDVLNAGAFWLNLYLIQNGRIAESFLRLEEFSIEVKHDAIRAAISQYYSLHIPSGLQLRESPGI